MVACRGWYSMVWEQWSGSIAPSRISHGGTYNIIAWDSLKRFTFRAPGGGGNFHTCVGDGVSIKVN